ncbi:hypothetical protein [Chitinophaga filiformis]|uniref:Beta-lactamase-inhibitor-like, PepSY-like n=1 Tax=Chitinophaga filiformis TaxID=104663 RepID=A0A1G8E5R4_CHIFI|nr:hypothetical protein [Chitinophaga filiformis]SDH65298.1 hypothetical protein SAMN04488121_1172 [Chitinophaga filiformis]
MKKIFFAAGVLLMSANIAFAHSQDEGKKTKAERKEIRKENNAEVSVFTKNQFYEDFPGATNIRFEKTNYFDEVAFTSGQKDMRAYYDVRSNLVGTTETKTFGDLPENAQHTIQKKYGDFNVERVFLYDDNEANETDMTLFDMAFDDADNYFVEMRKNSEVMIVKVDMAGNVSFFKSIK